MKKLALVLILIFPLMMLSAAQASTSYYLNLDDSDINSYKIGFSASGDYSTAEVYAEGLSLDVVGTGAANSSSPLYVWWDIWTTDAFTLAASIVPFYQHDADGNTTGEPLHWSATGTNLLLESDTRSYVALESTKSGSFRNLRDTKALSITVDNIVGVVAADYTATITLELKIGD